MACKALNEQSLSKAYRIFEHIQKGTLLLRNLPSLETFPSCAHFSGLLLPLLLPWLSPLFRKTFPALRVILFSTLQLSRLLFHTRPGETISRSIASPVFGRIFRSPLRLNFSANSSGFSFPCTYHTLNHFFA